MKFSMAVGSYDEDGDRPGGRGVVGRLAFRGLGVRGVEERLLALSATRTFRSSWLVVRVMLLPLVAPAILVLSWKPFASAARGIESRFEGLTQRRFLAWVLGGALALRLAWISLIPIHLEADWLEYDGYALRLAQTGVFSVDGRPTTVRVPGYPALLAAVYKVCGHSPKAGVLVNILLGIAIVALSYLLVRRQWGRFAPAGRRSFWRYFRARSIFRRISPANPFSRPFYWVRWSCSWAPETAKP